MITKIQKWGNSQGVRIPKEVLRLSHIAMGDEVDIEVHHQEIILKPVKPTRGTYRLRELLSDCDRKPGEETWGAPVGKELW